MKWAVKLWSGAGYWMNETIYIDSYIDDCLDDLEALAFATVKSDELGYKYVYEEVSHLNNDLENNSDYMYLDRSKWNKTNIYLFMCEVRIKVLEQ